MCTYSFWINVLNPSFNSVSLTYIDMVSLTQTWTCLQVVDFTYPLYEDEFTVVVQPIKDDNVLTPLFKPLHVWVWLCIASSCIMVALCLWLVIRRSLKLGGDLFGHSLWQWIWYCGTSFLGQGSFSRVLLNVFNHFPNEYTMEPVL